LFQRCFLTHIKRKQIVRFKSLSYYPIGTQKAKNIIKKIKILSYSPQLRTAIPPSQITPASVPAEIL